MGARAGFVALLVGTLAAGALAGNRGIALRLGDTATGEIGPVPADADDFLVEMTEGTVVNASVIAPKGSTLIPYLRFYGPDGQQATDLTAYATGIDTSKFNVKKYPVPTTGTWIVRVVGATPASLGTYQLKLKGKAPKKEVNAGVSLTDGEVKEFPFGGHEDGTVTLKLTDRSGPPLSLPNVRILGPSGDPIPGLTPALARKGKALSAKKVPLTDGFGVYVLEVTGPPAGGPSVFDVSIQVKNPKLVKATVPVSTVEPQVSTVTPSVGPPDASLVIKGTGFQAGAVVWLDDMPAASVVVQDATTIQCVAPAGAAATAGLLVDVSVQNPDGQENGKTGAFRYAAPPVPSGVLPGIGATAGNQLVTVYGTGFRSGAAGYVVTFGGNPATNVNVVSDVQIQCRTPAGSPGLAEVVVTDDFDQAGIVPVDFLYIAPPTLGSVSPAKGPSTGGTLVTLTGVGFRPADRVYIGGRDMGPVTFLSSTSIRVTTAPSPGGLFPVTVIDEVDQSSTLTDAFRFETRMTDRTAGLPAQGGPSAPAGWEIATGDLDGDGDRDVVIADDWGFANPTGLSNSSLHVLRNGGGLNFADASLSALPTPPFFVYPYVSDRSWQGRSVQMGDLDGDADLDLVVTNRDAFSAYPYYYGSYGYYYYLSVAGTRVLLNDGTGKFSNPTKALTTYYYSSGLGYYIIGGYYSVVIDRWQADKSLLGDLDGDGKNDLVLVSGAHIAHIVSTAGGYYAYPGGSSSTRVLKGKGDGTFQYLGGAVPWSPTDTYGFPYLDDFSGTDARLGDLDGDGAKDIVVTHRSLRPSYAYPYSYPYSYGSGYLIGTRVLIGVGNGGFNFSYASMPVTHGYATGSADYLQADAMEMGDLDGDGDLDMVLATPYSFYYYDSYLAAGLYRPGVRILENDGSGAFQDVTTAAWGGPFLGDPNLNALSVSIGDVDGDGARDLVLVTQVAYEITDGVNTRTTGTRIFLNDGSGGFSLAPVDLFPDTTVPNGLGIFWTGGESFLGDLDGDSDLDVMMTTSYNYYAPGGWYTMVLEQK
jgi:hypothetical protein